MFAFPSQGVMESIKSFKTNNGIEFIKYLHIAHMTKSEEQGFCINLAECERCSLQCAMFISRERDSSMELFAFSFSNICVSVNQILLLYAPQLSVYSTKHTFFCQREKTNARRLQFWKTSWVSVIRLT